jgi:pyrroline-5-carboxylate reductase
MTAPSAIALTGKLVLVGAGKMGGAMLEGWLAAGMKPGQVVVIDPSPPPSSAALIAANAIALNPPVAAIAGVEVVVMATKPQIMDEVLVAVGGLAHMQPLILSVAAGKTIATFEQAFGPGAAVIRSIPNTPAAIGRGITAMVANPHVTRVQADLARALLLAVGEVVTVDDEALIDAVTAVSGSGPAYVFYLTECLARAGAAAGLPQDLAMQLARATVSGAGELMHRSGIEARTLRENVTSPKGTTWAALQVLMAADGLDPLLARAVKAATVRSRELAA